MARVKLLGLIALFCLVLAGCATPDRPLPVPVPPAVPVTNAKPRAVPQDRQAIKLITGQSLVVRLLPPVIADREGWAEDMHGALVRLGIEPHASNVCAVVAITELESGFRADPPVPDLAGIARREIERRRAAAGIPRFLVQAALALPSSDGRSYAERLQRVGTERQLSDLYEDFARRMPLPKTFFAAENPVRTGGPMQVSIPFARAHAAARPYPYGVKSIRDEVFTRRGGLYFGVAHLLDYPAPYDEPIYRFADYNAGRYASRNAAFQSALGELAGEPLVLDGDLLERTERAALRLAPKLGLGAADIRRDLALATDARFEQTPLYSKVFALAGRGAPRAMVPAIEVRTAKTSRILTTDGFAKRAVGRFLACMARG